MTREEIIDGLQFTVDMFLFDPDTGEDREEYELNDMDKTTIDACKGAIELLRQEPCDDMEREYEKAKALFSKVVKSADCISRQAVLDINERHHEQMPNHINHKIRQEIKDLPSVQPKTGHWIKLYAYYKCSECSLTTSERGKNFYRYCPNCGCRMEG